MRILRSMAVWITAIGLLGSTAMLRAQSGGNGQNNGNSGQNNNGNGQNNGGYGQHTGISGNSGLSGNAGMSAKQSASQSGMEQSGNGSSQMGTSSGGVLVQPGMAPAGGKLDDASRTGNPRAEEEMEKLRSTERQKKLVADTQRLLSLANELKADMDKSSKDTLSLDVVRKADEIEKLAHSVKERMKGV